MRKLHPWMYPTFRSLLFCAVLFASQPTSAQSGFVYKGTLIVGGVKVTGNYDFAFSLWDAPSGGAQVAILNKNSVAVNSGAYTVTLDFGAKTFSGAPLYMQIQYRKTGTANWSTISGRLLLSVRFSLVAQSAMGLQGRPVSTSAPSNGQVLRWNGTSWTPANLVVYSAGAGLALAGGVFSIAPLGVTSAMLASNAVTSAKIASGAVTPTKLAWPFVYSGSTNGFGFLLSVTNGSGTGVYGKGTYSGLTGESAGGTGVIGISSSSIGVYAESQGSTAVMGESQNKEGVWGIGRAGTGVRGTSDASYGVFGNSSATIGVFGVGPVNGVEGDSTNGYGVAGYSNKGFGVRGHSGYQYGVYGSSATSWAGYFGGPLYAQSFSSPSKAFLIDHPVDPANKYLTHSCVESSERLNTYSGNVVLDEKGAARVQLPEWFEPLNRDFRYQLTAIGAPGPNLFIAQKVQGRSFAIGGGAPGMEVSWQISGVRQDRYAVAHPLQVEQMKPEKERGKYLSPIEHGQPLSLSIDVNQAGGEVRANGERR